MNTVLESETIEVKKKTMVSLKELTWTSLSVLRNSDPKLICDPKVSIPRLARDESYGRDIIDAWKVDISSSHTSRNNFDTFGSPFPYECVDGVQYSGYVVIPSTIDLETVTEEDKLPVVVLFHTGAGPQDIFNRFQADKLCREKFWGEKGCIVFVADIISDETGWCWGDRPRYWNARQSLLKVSTNNIDKEEKEGKQCRWKLRKVISASLSAITSIAQVDQSKIAAIGFCLGGQPILELGRMQPPGLRGLASFHGLFDDISLADQEVSTNNNNNNRPRRVLICNGAMDPWIKEHELELAIETYEKCGWSCQLLNFKNVLHNFSNPRTKYDDEGFGYDEHAAITSWDSTIELLQDVFQL